MRYPKYATILLLASALAPNLATAKAVFCHYLVQRLSEQNVKADIDAAGKMGCDAFALDLTNPSTDWTKSTLKYMFDYAATIKFRLFFSLDTSASPNIHDNDDLLKQYLPNKAYYKVDGVPFLSTFHGGNIKMADWISFLASHGNPYFVPNFDDSADYSSDPTTYLTGIKDIVNGTFSWDTAWPVTGSKTPVSNMLDTSIQSAAKTLDKTYMVPISTLQFKDMGELGFWHRGGDITLPRRMSQILSMPTQADDVEIISWNDAGESHYIGEIHTESLPPPYANPSQWDHTAWQPLFTSFIDAYKAGVKCSSAMVPPADTPAIGAVWYHTVLCDAKCAKPRGGETITDSVNFAVVLPKGAKGYNVRIYSGDKPIKTIPAKEGLNYANVPGMVAGKVRMELIDAKGEACMTAEGGLEVAKDAEGHCNYNYQVVGLKEPGALKDPTPA